MDIFVNFINDTLLPLLLKFLIIIGIIDVVIGFIIVLPYLLLLLFAPIIAPFYSIYNFFKNKKDNGISKSGSFSEGCCD